MKYLKSNNGTIIKIYSSSKETSAQRYSDLQKYLLKAAAADGTIESFKKSLERIKAFIQEKQDEGALAELDNSILSLNNVINGVNYYTYAFAVLVAEIGNKPCLDITDDGLDRTISELRELDIAHGVMVDEVNEVKKK